MATKNSDENKNDVRIGIVSNDGDSGDNNNFTVFASDNKDIDEVGSTDSLDILGDKENVPPLLHKNTTTENDDELKRNTENKIDSRLGILSKNEDSGDNSDITFCASDTEDILYEIGSNDSIDILGDKENVLPLLHKNTTTENDEELKRREQTAANTENKIDSRLGILSKNEDSGDNSDITFCASDTEDILYEIGSNDSIDILGDKEYVLPLLHKNTTTENDEELKRREQTAANTENKIDSRFGILSKNEDSGDNSGITFCASDTKDISIDILGNKESLTEPINTRDDVTASSSKSGQLLDKNASRSVHRSSSSDSSSSSSSNSSSSSSTSSSSTEDDDNSVQDPDFVNHVGTESASTESLESSFEISSPQPSTSNNSNSTVKKGRKRVAAPMQWIQNKRKHLRNTGQTYKTKKNKVIPARSVKPPCGEKCRFQCSNKMTEEERRHIFEDYWKMGDINRQRNYINHKLEPVKRKYRYTTTQKGRDYNRAFYLYSMGQKIRVCKQFFMRTLDINERVIRTVISKLTPTAVIANDQRGKHEQQTCVPQEIKDSVRTHINSIPRIESHYLRQQTTSEYIEGGKTIADLHRDYKEERKKSNVAFANYVMYAKIFNTEFNLGFFVPKKDLCELCDSYENASNNEKENIKEKYNQHLLEKKLSRLERKEDKKKVDSNYIVAIYDLQAVLPCPKGEISVFYYKSKLNTFNLTITELETKDAECYLWHEGEGNRGSDEIGSYVYKYIEKKLSSRITDSDSDNDLTTIPDTDLNPNVDIVFYSDSCCGQNKNQFIIALYIFTVLKFTKLRSITHKFLIPGHTQNENDSVHSVIEKEIKINLKSGPIYVPLQYAQIIRTAKKQGKPYSLNELSHRDFISLKMLQADLKFSMKGLKITEVKIIKYTKETPDLLLYKKSYAETEFSELKIWRRLPRLPELRPAYSNGIELGSRKKAHLLSLIRDNHIPQFYASFYNTIFNNSV